MTKNLIKLWLIALASSASASNLYRFGYFDAATPVPLKAEVVTQWLQAGLRASGVKGTVQTQVKAIDAKSSDDDLRSLDFLILRADLEPARAIAERFYSLGGKMVVSDQWTREDIGIEKLAVLSVALPSEQRVDPLVGWLNAQAAAEKSSKRGVYLIQSDSDFDKIWYFEFLRHPALAGWNWQELVVPSTGGKLDFSKQKVSESLLLINRMNTDLIKSLGNSMGSLTKIVVAIDPHFEKPNEGVAEFFKKNIMTYYLTTYPKGLTNEARDFDKSLPGSLAADALLHDALMLTGKAVAKSSLRINTAGKFFGALDGLGVNGATGEVRISRGKLLREVFVVEQRGEDRVLQWRSGLLK